MPLSRTLLPPRLRASLSQVVRLGLPLGALVLMSTIFLVARSVDPNRAAALSDLDLAALTREPRIGTARIATVGTDNSAINIDAASIRSVNDPQVSGPLNLLLDKPDGTVAFTSGGLLEFRAKDGQIEQAEGQVILTEDVWLRTEQGYEMTMTILRGDMDGTAFDGTGPISGTGPVGTLSANDMTIRALPQTSGGYLLAFKGDVRLLYTPQE